MMVATERQRQGVSALQAHCRAAPATIAGQAGQQGRAGMVCMHGKRSWPASRPHHGGVGQHPLRVRQILCQQLGKEGPADAAVALQLGRRLIL